MDSRQLSFFDSTLKLAGLVPALKAAMRQIIGDGDEGRKSFVDKLNFVAKQSQIRLTGGNCKQISLDTLNKILAPSDNGHPPSIAFVLCFCKAAHDYTPLRLIAQSLGFELLSEENRIYLEYGKAILEEKKIRQRKKYLEGSL